MYEKAQIYKATATIPGCIHTSSKILQFTGFGGVQVFAWLERRHVHFLELHSKFRNERFRLETSRCPPVDSLRVFPCVLSALIFVELGLYLIAEVADFLA